MVQAACPARTLHNASDMTQRPSGLTLSPAKEISRASEGFSDTVDQLASHITSSCHVNQVFGAPVQVGDMVVIPVARVIGGFGAGSGAGARTEDGEPGRGVGLGGGGGFMVNPCGVFEISADGARFKPSGPDLHWLTSLADLGLGLLRRWLRRAL